MRVLVPTVFIVLQAVPVPDSLSVAGMVSIVLMMLFILELVVVKLFVVE